MNTIFILILVSSILLLLLQDPSGILTAMLSGGMGGLQFGLKLIVIYSIWLSMLIILEKANIDKYIAKAIQKPLKKLFPKESNEAYLYLSLNLSCNILGMGGASTPAGIKAVESMGRQKNKIMLAVINSCSIQLIPTTVIAMRAVLHSKIDIIVPSLIASLFSTALAIILVKILVKDN